MNKLKQQIDEFLTDHSKELTLSIWWVIAVAIIITFLPAVLLSLLCLKVYQMLID